MGKWLRPYSGNLSVPRPTRNEPPNERTNEQTNKQFAEVDGLREKATDDDDGRYSTGSNQVLIVSLNMPVQHVVLYYVILNLNRNLLYRPRFMSEIN